LAMIAANIKPIAARPHKPKTCRLRDFRWSSLARAIKGRLHLPRPVGHLIP
jgi:hypothetical protein